MDIGGALGGLDAAGRGSKRLRAPDSALPSHAVPTSDVSAGLTASAGWREAAVFEQPPLQGAPGASAAWYWAGFYAGMRFAASQQPQQQPHHSFVQIPSRKHHAVMATTDSAYAEPHASSVPGFSALSSGVAAEHVFM